MILLRKELMDTAFFFISKGILFQTTALYKLLFDLGMRKFPLDIDFRFEAVS